ncbi:response regulator transcription factor [Thiosocius teredinicola]|uniref:response regulator transcription factor n=1 Tax=Thiosocius teredinicola TaxID=1973002 RepID=UPI0009914DCC
MRKVLIVDDNENLRRLISLTLQGADYELHEADSGDAALQRVSALTPDIVLLDVMMPGSADGYEVCRQIKSNDDLRHAKVIILSARGQKADLDAGREAGADHYLIKPFSPVELLQLLKTYD